MNERLTDEDREHIERYTSYKTDGSPITKAMRKALARIDALEGLLVAWGRVLESGTVDDDEGMEVMRTVDAEARRLAQGEAG